MVTKLKSKKNIINFLLFILFFGTLVLAPNDVNSKVIILMVVVSFFYFSLRKFQLFVKNHMALLVLFLLIVLSLIYTEDFGAGVQKIQRVLIIPLFFFIYSSIGLSKKLSLQILKSIVFIVLIATVYSHTVVIDSFIENGESSIRSLFNLNYSYLNLGNTLDIHPTYYSYFILTATIVTVDLLKKSKSIILKFLYVLLILYFSFFIVHLSSRIGLLGLYIVLLFNVILFIRSSGSWKKGALILAVVHLTLFAIVWNIGVTKYRIQHIFGFEYYTGYKVNDGQHKLRLWEAAINANHNFIFGNGMGDINETLKEQYVSLDNDKAIDENYNAHNQFIEYYVGIGILGLFTFIYILYTYAITFLRAKNYLGLQFIIITSVLCLTESLWSRHHGFVFFIGGLGVLLGLSDTLHLKKEQKTF